MIDYSYPFSLDVTLKLSKKSKDSVNFNKTISKSINETIDMRNFIDEDDLKAMVNVSENIE